MFYSERVLNTPPSLLGYVERDHGQAVYYPAAAFFFELIKKVLAENEGKKVCVFYSTTYCATIEYADFLLTDEERNRLKLYNLDSLQGTSPTYLGKNPAYLVINPTTARKMHMWGWPLYLDADKNVYTDLKPELEVAVNGSSIQQMYRLNERQVRFLMETH